MSHPPTLVRKPPLEGDKHPEDIGLEDAYQASDPRPVVYYRDDKLSPSPVMTAEEEKRLWRKVDCRFLPIVILLYLCSFLDRSNIG